MRVLVVEDDTKIAGFLGRGLSEAGYTTDHVTSAEEAFGAVTYGEIDVVVLDLNLPGKDGVWLVERLRERGSAIPILVLSARAGVDDRVSVIRSGADDYMTKPFSFAELVARLEALLRRSNAALSGSAATKLVVGDLTLDLLTREVTREGDQMELQPREFSLLEYLMRNAEQVLTKTMILERVWHYDFDPQTNVVDVLVSRLRAKIDRNYAKKIIHTIRGVGYSLRVRDGADGSKK